MLHHIHESIWLYTKIMEIAFYNVLGMGWKIKLSITRYVWKTGSWNGWSSQCGMFYILWHKRLNNSSSSHIWLWERNQVTRNEEVIVLSMT